MKIYTIIWNDRHVDPSAHTFSTPELAISEARRIAQKYVREDDDYEERTSCLDAKMIFSATYSCEGDGLMVVVTELDELLDSGD